MMSDGYLSLDTLDKIETALKELEEASNRIGAAITDSINGFAGIEMPIVVCVLEDLAAGVKANFDAADQFLYDFVRISSDTMIIKSPDVPEVDDDDES